MSLATAWLVALPCLGAVGRATTFVSPDRGWVMSLLAAWLIPAAIIALGGALLVWHWRSWRSVRGQDAEPIEVGYQRRRFRRRMQTSGMLVLLGAALAGGQAISPEEHPSLFVFFWLGVALLALWAMALALTDVLATRAHVGRLVRRQMAAHAKLQAELARKQAELDAKLTPKDEP